VFEIVKTGGSYAGTPTILVSLNGLNGANSTAGLIADSAGELFGTTETGGGYNEGTVFEIAKTGGTYASTSGRLQLMRKDSVIRLCRNNLRRGR